MNVEEENVKFPVGMKVLVVDDNPQELETLLHQCQYHVTSTSSSVKMDVLLENKNNFDLAIINVDMPQVEYGLRLLQFLKLQMDLPVIMLMSQKDNDLVKKGLDHGACDHLIKPHIRIVDLDKIWQHVEIRRKSPDLNKKRKSEGEVPQDDQELNHNNNKRCKENENECEEIREHCEQVSSTNNKKPRLLWSTDLHQKFVEAVNHLGVDKAVPKKILEMMNDKRLSRENVASHLQKYRLNLKNKSGSTTHDPNMDYSRSYPPATALIRSNTLSHVNTYIRDPSTQWHQQSNHNVVDPRSVLIMQQNNWFSAPAAADSLSQDFSNDGWCRAAAQPIRACHDHAPSSDTNTPTSHQAYFHGNNFGVHQYHHQAAQDDQFLSEFDEVIQLYNENVKIESKNDFLDVTRQDVDRHLP